ncbi:hypothetical protein POM88_054431 [Heracleum sosnowskyi]|uniref:Uncharacterized protein n=1 Tax=Heracleum sosnowskyi TaxID=360622 RepID=A0AAD8LUT9_9APIA|nr:hypothetical protein POM88_054431 [Heracleum sosnowskyi]
MLYNSSLGSSSRKARSRLYKGYTRFSKLLHTSRKIARHRHEPLPLLEHQMARPCQTRRKRVAPARGLPADILEAIAEDPRPEKQDQGYIRAIQGLVSSYTHQGRLPDIVTSPYHFSSTRAAKQDDKGTSDPGDNTNQSDQAAAC